jgi:phosphoribosylamine---glycine ligase
VARTPTVCVIGAGGREHALATLLARSADVVVCPGNPGMPGRSPEGHVVSTLPADPGDADLYVIGPEAPLVGGLADRLRAKGRRVVGPGRDGARLEGSKGFMKDVLTAAGVPTARYGVFSALDDAVAFLRTLPGPWVVKTDGLAAGKGVLVTSSLDEAEADVAAKLGGAYGEAGRSLVVEEGLTGEECSLLALCDGESAVPMVPAQDFKRAGDGDSGPNTGGMGAYAPVPGVDVDELMAATVEPVVAELRRRGIEYRGVLYAGVMLTAEGPKVLEFNVRFGDPEAQLVLPLLAEDPVGVLTAVATGGLHHAVPSARLAARAGAAVCVVLAADGYPTAPRSGDPIEGLADDGQLADALPGVTVFHAGTRRVAPGSPFLTAGGRVLGITAVASELAEARRLAYAGAASVTWEGVHYRRDVAAGGHHGGAHVAVAGGVEGVVSGEAAVGRQG